MMAGDRNDDREDSARELIAIPNRVGEPGL